VEIVAAPANPISRMPVTRLRSLLSFRQSENQGAIWIKAAGRELV
jgi:hypothetical protein